MKVRKKARKQTHADTDNKHDSKEDERKIESMNKEDSGESNEKVSDVLKKRKGGLRMKRQSKRKKTYSNLEEEGHLKTFLKIVLDEEAEDDPSGTIKKYRNHKRRRLSDRQNVRFIAKDRVKLEEPIMDGERRIFRVMALHSRFSQLTMLRPVKELEPNLKLNALEYRTCYQSVERLEELQTVNLELSTNDPPTTLNRQERLFRLDDQQARRAVINSI
ncbi:hypothetical protein Tco_1047322 [Tanacetum coccineum]